MPPFLLAFLAVAGADPAIVVEAPRFPGPRIPDKILATMRGGVRLPNGLDLILGIDIQTRIDGVLALRTVYASEGSQPGIRVFTDGTSTPPPPSVPPTATYSPGRVVTAPWVVVDRSPTGTTVLPASDVAPPTVNLVVGDPAIWLSGETQQQVPVTANGPAVAVPYGQVTLSSDDNGTAVTLAAPALEVRQLIGSATGVVIANSADNRAIDTVSAVNVDLRGLTPGLLAAGFAAQRAMEGRFGR